MGRVREGKTSGGISFCTPPGALPSIPTSGTVFRVNFSFPASKIEDLTHDLPRSLFFNHCPSPPFFFMCLGSKRKKRQTLRRKCVKQDARRWEMCVRGGGMMGADEGEREKS